MCFTFGGAIISEDPEIINRNGEVAFLIDGWDVENPESPRVAKFGILQEDLKKRNDRGQISSLAQFDGIVCSGLILAKYVFRGLKRPLYTDGSMDGDSQKFVYTWRPTWDFDWPDCLGKPRRLEPPKNSVFVVLVTINKRHKEKWPEVYGWIDRWNWVDEDSRLPGAPLNWHSRYEGKIFTRKGA